MKKALFGWLGAIGGAAAIIVAANQPHHAPAPHAPATAPSVPHYALVLHVCDGPCEQDRKIPGAIASIEGQPDLVTDGAGNGVWPGLAAGRYAVCVAAPGFKRLCADHAVPADGDASVALERDAPPVRPIHVDGKVFRDDTGALWQYRGATDFSALKRFIGGEDLTAHFDALRAYGANTIRVLTTMVNIASLPPGAYTDGQLGAFLAAAHARGLRVELVALADAQDWPIAAQRQQAQRILNAAAAAGGVDLVEVANEPFKNSAQPRDVMAGIGRPPGVLAASGDYDIPQGASAFWHLDYQTYHSDRDQEWPRKAKDAQDYRDGFSWADGSSFPGVRVPVIDDEPMGADEVDQPGRRSNVASDFYWLGATSALMSAGATFHCTACITSDALGPNQAAAAQAFFAGLSAVPSDTQTWMYTRGGLTNNPLEHDDAAALRTFCKIGGGDAWCVVIRPTDAWRAVPRDGWRIVAAVGPRGSVLHLQR